MRWSLDWVIELKVCVARVLAVAVVAVAVALVWVIELRVRVARVLAVAVVAVAVALVWVIELRVCAREPQPRWLAGRRHGGVRGGVYSRDDGRVASRACSRDVDRAEGAVIDGLVGGNVIGGTVIGGLVGGNVVSGMVDSNVVVGTVVVGLVGGDIVRWVCWW